MKTIGLIGGMSWQSTLMYYRIINETVKSKMGGFHSAKILLYSCEFEDIIQMQHKGQWDDAGKALAAIARKLEHAGADLMLIAANTMHKVANTVQQTISVPLLHIVDTTAKEIGQLGIKKVGLLGTKFTMEENFYRDRLKLKHGIEVIVPTDTERTIVHNIIYDELDCGIINPSSRKLYQDIIATLRDRGAQGIVLGCTEIPLLIKQKDVSISVFDTTYIHARAAAEYAMDK